MKIIDHFSWCSTVLTTANRKSRIAIEIAYQSQEKEKDRSVYWLSAMNPKRFYDSLREVLIEIPNESMKKFEKLNTSTEGDNKTLDVPKTVKDWLSSGESGRWLIILDNVDTMELFETQDSQEHPYIWYIPKSPKGRVLMTTRNRAVADQLVKSEWGLINVPTMTVAEALNLYKINLPKDPTPEEKMKELADAQDFLPLVIMQAVAYIRSFKELMNIEKYLTEFRKTEADEERLLSREFQDEFRDEKLKNSVIISWQINFTQIENQGKNQGLLTTEVLSCLAVLDREAIPMFILTDVLAKENLTEDVGILCQYAFIFEAPSPTEAPTEKVWTMHRLVHRTMKIWLRKRGDQNYWETKVLQALTDKFTVAIKESTLWKARLLLPHVRRALSYTAASGRIDSELRELVGQFERPTWLSILSQRSESAAIQAKQYAIEGTCQWLLAHKIFRAWLDKHHSMLFLFGRPGTGKTTLW